MCHFKVICFFIILTSVSSTIVSQHNDDDVLVLTVASHDCDGLARYLRSARIYDIEPQLLGFGQTWLGGDMKFPGGGYKINLIRQYLNDFKEDREKIVVFTDSFDVMFLSKMDEVVRRFLKYDARILFSAEAACWPNASLAQEYPPAPRGVPYLNSGGFLGYAADVYKMLSLEHVDNEDDDQLYYTRMYLNHRDELNMMLDHTSEIFQNLYGAVSEVQLLFESDSVVITNSGKNTQPLILHGNGPSKTVLNNLGNYLANSWTVEQGCIACTENVIKIEEIADEDYPTVLIAIFIEEAMPFLEEFLTKIHDLDFPKKKLHLFIHNAVKYHSDVVRNFTLAASSKYLSYKEVLPTDEISQWSARNLALNHCLNKKCDYYFNIDAEAHLDNSQTLKLLIEQNRTVVAPLLVRPEKSWSNFWGALSRNGFYARSSDYMAIVHNERRGLWNVPFIGACYLLNGTLLQEYGRDKLSYIRDELDADMAFCANLRDLNVFMYVSNRIDFGHLVNPETFDTSRAVPEMYQLFENPFDWQKRYIHPDFTANLDPAVVPKQPCPDVFWFPVTTMRFCTDLIQMMETFGQWSDGTNSDPRLTGGYEAVPTRDIHMNQVGWERHWLHFLKVYVVPLQERVFIGYHHDPPHSLMNFVVRYRPNEQPSLRPHHDSSTFTINLALNTAGVDYEGGGCHFIRYNCSVTDTKPGWLLMHPGRLTHYHEGLLVTKGTRYIMISFVNP